MGDDRGGGELDQARRCFPPWVGESPSGDRRSWAGMAVSPSVSEQQQPVRFGRHLTVP
jgi:hypothetical protein